MASRVSESEKVVMEVLWQESPLNSVEIVQRLGDQDWTEKTVKSFLNRLVNKGVLNYQTEGRKYLYSPAVSREDYLSEESEGFLEKMFRGDMKELLTTFVNNKQLSKNELDHLKSLLDTDAGEDANKSKASKTGGTE